MIVEFLWMEDQAGQPVAVWQMNSAPRIGETVHLGILGADPEPDEGKVVGVSYSQTPGPAMVSTCLARVVLERYPVATSYREEPKKQAPLF